MDCQGHSVPVFASDSSAKPEQSRLRHDSSSDPDPPFSQSRNDLLMATTPSPVMAAMGWRPTYLRTRILGAFCALLALIVVALEILVLVSARNNGIASGVPSDHYLWTYGPTAFLTAIAALFSRVEYQSKMIAPWQRMSKQPAAASKSLMLDYVSQFQPLALYRSLRNKDFTVSAATAVSVLLKIMIILSTGLITLSMTAVKEDAIPMVLQNSFLDDNTTLANAGTMPRYLMMGISDDIMEYPPGLSKDFAFQTVETSLPPTAQIHVTLDGLTNSLVCEPASLVWNETKYAGIYTEYGWINITIISPSCNAQVAQAGQELLSYNNASEKEPTSSSMFGKFFEVQCDGITDDSGNRVMVWFGQMERFTDENVNSSCAESCFEFRNLGRLLNSTQMLCRPTYYISKVDLIKNGTDMQTVTLSRSSDTRNRTLDHVTPWSIMKAHYNAFGFPDIRTWPWTFEIGNETIYVDPYAYTLLQNQISTGANTASLYDLDSLEGMVQSYYRQFGAIIARQFLMKAEPISINGSALIIKSRLVVRSWSSQWMAGLAAACFLIILTMFPMAPKHEGLPCSPTDLFGVAVLVYHSPGLLVKLRDAGDADSKSLSSSLKTSTSQAVVSLASSSRQPQFSVLDTSNMDVDNEPKPYQQSQSSHTHPGLLHPWSWLPLCMVLFAVVAILEITLHESNIRNGLGDVGDDTYTHYLWTTMPALILEGVTLMISSMDFKIRSLAPYIILNNIVTARAFMDLEFLDMSIPWAMYREFRLRSLGVFATTTAMLVASLFTIFSSSLFQAVSLSQIGTITLEMQNFIANNSIDNDDFSQSVVATSLILEGNLSYPKFTYEDLVLPQMAPLASIPGHSISNTPLLFINTTVPAVRAHLVCRTYNSSSIRTNRTLLDPNSGSYLNSLGITVDGETCELDSEDKFAKHNVVIQTGSTESYFGVGSGFFGAGVRSCSEYFHVWGRFDWYSAERPVQHVAALGCNYTFEVVDVDVRFLGAELAIDPLRPPMPLEDTARSSTVSAEWSWSLYFHIPKPASTEIFSNIFAMLTTSRWALPLSMLGDPAHDLDVAAALRFQHGILAAQALNSNRVLPTNVSDTEAMFFSGNAISEQDGARYTYEASVTDEAGRRRVVQDAASTRVLEALLIATALLLLLGWATLPRTDVFPQRSPTTVASMVALLAGGNLLDLLPEDAQWRNKTDILSALGRDTKFWLGWGRMPDEEGIAMGNENENGISRFGIFAVPPDEEVGPDAGLQQR